MRIKRPDDSKRKNPRQALLEKFGVDYDPRHFFKSGAE
jgi:hypothetical protein